MAKNDEFVEYILEMLQDFGLVSARAMFGAHGIYREEIMFAIVANGTLYIKADDENRALFEDRGLVRFSYTRAGTKRFMSFYEVPEEALEDNDELRLWANEGYEAARRSKK